MQTLGLLTTGGCGGQEDYIIDTTVKPQTEEEIPAAFLHLFTENICHHIHQSSFFCLYYGYKS